MDILKNIKNIKKQVNQLLQN